MDIEVSTATAKAARTYKLSPEELAFADLLALGWPPEDAWACAIRKGVTWTKAAKKEALMELMENEGVKKRMGVTKGASLKTRTEQKKKDKDLNGKALLERATNKETKIIELQAKLEATHDTSEWLKINQQIIDVTRMKQEEVKRDDNTIHHFLPVQYPTGCQDCLYSRCETCRYMKAFTAPEDR